MNKKLKPKIKQKSKSAVVKFPWMPKGKNQAKLAIARVRDSLLTWLTVNDRIHVETLMVVIGALAGTASQNAIWEACIKTPNKPIKGLVEIITASGETFYFGSLLNSYLVSGGRNRFPLWSFVATAAMDSGAKESELPDLKTTFERFAETVGTRKFEKLQIAAKHKPHISPRRAVEEFWLPIVSLLERSNQPKGTLTPECWPIILALVTQQYIYATKDVLRPDISAQLVMESAILSSKFDMERLQLADRF